MAKLIKKSFWKNFLMVATAVVLTAALAVGGTLAYLTQLGIPQYSNVYSVGNIDVKLSEDTALIRNGKEVAIAPEVNDEGVNKITYTQVLPGDYLQKEVTVKNDGTNAAYVAVTVTLNNADKINLAIDEVYEKKGYSTEAVQEMYDYIFDGWGINYNKVDADNKALGMRLTIDADNLGDEILQVDSTKTTKKDDTFFFGYNNWFKTDLEKNNTEKNVYGSYPLNGYYTADMGPYELSYTYYILLEKGESTTLFKGLNVPAHFNADQLAMFDGLQIDVKAAAIQADNIADGEIGSEAHAKEAFTLLKAEMADEKYDNDIGELWMVDNANELAFALERGGKIVITKDIEVTDTETLTIAKGVTVTLDLNGKTIRQTKGQTAAYQMILNDGSLTINDSVGSGKISYTDSGNGGEYISDTIYNRGTLVINGGTIENLSSDTVAKNGYPHVIDTNSGSGNTSVTINGGKLYCANYSAIRMFCNSATDTNTVEINGGEIYGRVDFQNPNAGSNKGSLTINGGTFDATVYKEKGRSIYIFGSDTTDSSKMELSIKGGTFLKPVDVNKTNRNIGESFNDKFITGGTFAKDPSAYVAEGYWAAKNADGTYTVKSKTLPNATVSVLDPITLTPGEHEYIVWPNGDDDIDRPLQIVMNFKANETQMEAAAGYYAKYKTDFYVTITGIKDNKFTADKCYLAGNYGNYGWIVIPIDGFEIENNVSYPVVSYYDANLTYENVCDYVKDFTAAIYIDPEILEANPNLEVKLELKLTSPDDSEVILIGDPAVYDVEDLGGNSQK